MPLDKLIHSQNLTEQAVTTMLLDGSVNFLSAIVILIVGWILASWAARGTRNALGKLRRFDNTLKPLIASLVRYGILVATVIEVLQRFGVEMTSLIAVLGAAGIAIGLALQGTLSNVAAGVMLIILRPFRVGDTVTVASQSGTVREVGLFTTILIGGDQSYISIPNAAIFGGVVINQSREPTTGINFTVSIDIASDVDKAEKIVMDILAKDDRVLKMPKPTTGTTALKEYAIDLIVRFWTMNADAEATKFDVQRRINDSFRRAGIKSPARRQTSIAREEPVASTAIRKAG